MKILKKLIIGNIEKQLISANIILELNACGRGFIVINAEQYELFTNKTVKISLGYNNELQRWFTGYVESEQPAKTGTKKLVIRELIGIYGQNIECSFQHPTIKDITHFLTKNYQLAFDLPDQEYVNTKIPHFKHSGTGYHLLKSIGQAFNIPDYVFYQKQAGTIYLGSYKDCYYADKPINFGDELNKITLTSAGADTITLPFMPKIRPGVILNDRKVKEVNLLNDELTITFDNFDKTTFQKQLEKNCPEITAGYHLPMFGRVEAISDVCSSGNISTPFRPRYAVDIQLLDANGNDAKVPIYKAVPLPVGLMGWEKGIYCYPDLGSIVEIAFAYGRADQPIIRNVYPINVAVPEVRHGEILLQQRPEVYQRIDKIGNMTRETDQNLNDVSQNHFITADYQESNITERKAIISADDQTTVLGNKMTNAGSFGITTLQDYGIGVGANYYLYTKQNYELTIDASQNILIKQNKQETITGSYMLQAQSMNQTVTNEIQVAAQLISEQAQTIYSIIAGSNAQVIAPTIWLGSNQINVTQCMLDTLDLIKMLADLTAAHIHGDSSPPNNASSIQAISASAVASDNKYSSIIAK